jgi:polysaccharide export outer membrane protein
MLRAGVITLLALLFAAPARAQNAAAEPHAVTDVIVRPGDVLRLKLWPDQQYSGDYPVEPSGAAVVPLLGEVHVGGKTLGDVRTDLRQRYAALTTNGVVVVSLQFRVSVIGAVQRPGLYQADASQTVFDALSQAGGMAPNADAERVRLIRNDQVIVLDAQQQMQTGAPILGLLLQSGDRIVVPEKQASWLTWQTALTLLQTVGLVVALARHP